MNQKFIDKTKTKKIIIIAFSILCSVLLVFVIALASLIEKNNQKQLEIDDKNFSSIKNILEYYGCKYKKEKESELEDFSLDIYTTFKYNLYDDQKSNEKFYNNVINAIAKFLHYKSFRLIDNDKEEKIEIQVVCADSKIKTIYINGIEDYFIYMDSKISLSQYKELKTTELVVQSPELQECITNDWDTKTNFGSRESIFQKYYIYFDEGIETRRINGKIYNIIFDKNYTNQVVNGFTVGTDCDIIISKLGEPTFKNDDKSIIGYKSDDIYVFFEKDQISIYRNNKNQDYSKFFKLVDKFLGDEYDLLDFMNELTYLWKDYDEYTYSENMVFLSYPTRGVDVKLNYEDTNGIVLYNNLNADQSLISKYIEHTEFIAQLQVDNIFNAEKRRVEKKNNYSVECKKYQKEHEKDDTRNRGNLYNYYFKFDNSEKIMEAYFISSDNQYPNCELLEAFDTYYWLNDTCFAYSIIGKGIYYYNLQTQEKGRIITGEEDFNIKSYENGILKYDDKEIEVAF